MHRGSEAPVSVERQQEQVGRRPWLALSSHGRVIDLVPETMRSAA
jgi:hypothetical protein